METQTEQRVWELERRLSVAERRSWAVFLLGVVAAGVAGFVLASRPAQSQSDGSTVHAPFKVVDRAGKVLAVIDSEPIPDSRGRVNAPPSGKTIPHFVLFTESGVPGVEARGGDKGGIISIFGPKGGYSVSLYHDGDGGSVSVHDNQGQSKGLFNAESGFTVFNKSGNRVAATLGANAEGGKLTVRGNDESPVATLEAVPGGGRIKVSEARR